MGVENRCLLIPVAALAVLLSLPGDAQSVRRTRECNNSVPFRPGVSPYEILQENPPLKDLWRTLGIPAKLRLSTSNGFTKGDEEIDCTSGCKAAIVSGDQLLREDGDDSIVRICTHFETTCRFLLLHRSSGRWSLVDYLDAPFEKYEPPVASVEAAQDRRWLVQRGFGGGGTGVYLADAEWFEIRCGSLESVLTLPSRGHDVNAAPARYFSTRFRGFHQRAGRESLEFGYVVIFQDYEHERQLWQEERTVVFSRANSNSAFAFDPAASSLSAAFKNKVFAFDSMDENDFIEFAYDRLMRIASDSTDNRREWLQGFLDGMSETAKVKALKAALGAPRRPPQR
jgi:hypothetical protein